MVADPGGVDPDPTFRIWQSRKNWIRIHPNFDLIRSAGHGVDPDPDQTFKKKQNPGPDQAVNKNLDLDPTLEEQPESRTDLISNYQISTIIISMQKLI